jgi:hypothetical protein
MPDVREVYHMVTQQKAPEPGALERQQRRQVRSARTKKIGGFAVAAVMGVAAIVLIIAIRSHETTSRPAHEGSTLNPEAAAVKVTRQFLAAFRAFDAQKAMSYVADGANLSRLIDGQVPDDAEGMSLMVGWLEAMGYEELNTSCRATASTPALGTTVLCDFDFHGIRSEAIGKGPFTGNTHTFILRDGKIVYGTIDWNLDEFSPQMWEPFRDWVRENHRKDFDVMYIDNGGNFRLTPRSIRLWEQRTQEWAAGVAQ